MAIITTDELQIKITVDDSGVDKALKDVEDKLRSLNRNIGSDTGYNLEKVVDGLAGISRAAGSFRGIDFGKIGTDITKMFESLKDFDYSKYANGIAGVKTAMSKMATGIETFSKSSFAISRAASEISSFPRTIEKLSAATNAQDFSNLASYFDKLGKATDHAAQNGIKISALSNGLQRIPQALEYYDNIDKFEPMLQTLSEFVPKLNAATAGLEDGTAKAFESFARGFNSILNIGMHQDELPGIIQGISDAVAQLVNNIGNIPADAAAKFVDIANAMGQLAVGMKAVSGRSGGASMPMGLGNIVSAFKQIPSTVNRATSAIKKFGSLIGKTATLPFRGVVNDLSEFARTFQKWGDRVFRVVAMRIIRQGITIIQNGIKEGVKNLYGWAQLVGNDFVPTMDSLATSFLYFKNSVGAAVSPLLDALAPAIEIVIDRIVEAVNWLNQLFAALAGKTTWRKAIRKATEYEDAASGATGAVKELERTVLGFDELNRLNDNNSSGRGGGASGTDYSGMFEEVGLADAFADWANTDDWFAMGQLIADKLNAGLANINWNEIEKTMQTWSKRIYTFLNGFIDELDWGLVGETLGNGLNVALGFLDDIVQNTNWVGLGSGIGTALNNAIEKADWSLIGRTLTNKLKVAFETLHGFIQTFSWDALREGLITAIGAAFDNADWGTAMIDLATFGAQIGRTALEMAKTVVKKLAEKIKKVDWKAVGSAITKVFEGFKWDEVIPDLVDLAVAFTGAIADVLTTADWDSALNGILEGVKKADWRRLTDNIVSIITSKLGRFAIELTLASLVIKGGTKMLGTMLMSSLASGLGGTAVVAGAGAGLPVIAIAAAAIISLELLISNADSIASWFAGIAEKYGIDVNGDGEGTAPGAGGYDNSMDNPGDQGTGAASGNNMDGGTWYADSVRAGELSADGANLNKTTATVTATKNGLASAPVIGATAGLSAIKNNLTKDQRTLGVWANYKSVIKGNLTNDQRTLSVWAKYNSVKNNLSEKQRTLAVWAAYNSVKNNLSEKAKTIAVKASASSISLSNKDVYGLKIHADSIIGPGGVKYQLKAGGGSFFGGSWHSIPQAANGGVFTGGSLFMAGEHGAEIVGSIGGRSEVLNASQLASVMYAAVGNAISKALSSFANVMINLVTEATNYLGDKLHFADTQSLAVAGVGSMPAPEMRSLTSADIESIVEAIKTTTNTTDAMSPQVEREQPINIYIGNERIASVVAKSAASTNYRSGGR